MRAFIETTLARKGMVPKIKVRERLSERDAFETEIALIKAIGRRDKNLGPLANMSDGGSGGNFGDLVRAAKAKWTPEKRAAISQQRSVLIRRALARLPEAERSRRNIAFVRRNSEALEQLRLSNPDYEKRRARKVKAGHAARTLEQKAATARKVKANTAPGRLSDSIRAFHASQTLEQRRIRVRGSLTKEQLRERAMRSNASQTAEQRSVRNRKGQANLSEEKVAARRERARLLSAGSKWINNGVRNRRLPPGVAIPDGWLSGRHR